MLPFPTPLARTDKRTHLRRRLPAAFPAILLALLMCFAPRASLAETVRVGIYQLKPILYSEGGQAKGLFADVLGAVAARQGWTLEYVPGSWQECLDRLSDGSIDLLPAIAYTAERDKLYDFTRQHLFMDWGVIYTRKDSSVLTLFALQGKSVAVLAGGINAAELENLLQRFGITAALVKKKEYAEVVEALGKGEVDAAGTTNLYSPIIESAHDVVRSNIVYAPVKMCFAVKQGTHAGLLRALDADIQALKDDKTSVYYKSMATVLNITQHKRGLPEWAAWGGAALAGAVLALAAFAWTLKGMVRSRTRKLTEANAALTNEVAERQRTEEMLRLSEARLSSTFELAAVGMAHVGLGGAWLKVNSRLCAITGYSREELLRLSFQDLTCHADLAGDLAMIGKLSRREIASYSREKRYIRKDGKLIWVSVDVSLAPAVPGGQEHLISVVQDITPRKEAEERLRQSERKFKDILENMPLIGISLDAMGRLVFANAHFLALTGWTRQEALGQDWLSSFIPPEMRPVMRDVFEASMNAGDAAGYSTYENEIMRKDGSRLMVAWSNTVSLDASGRAVETTCLGLDVTERTRAARELLQAKEAAEAASVAKSQFLANMSHEIRTPLNGALGMLQLLEDTELDEEQKEYLDAAVNSARRLTRLLSDILDLARIEAGRLSMESAVFSPRALLDSVLELYPRTAREHGVELDCLVGDCVPGRLTGDEARLRQILFNLVGNALKFTTLGSVRVEVSAMPGRAPDQARVLFVVSDTGAGIRDAWLGTIFEPFVQVDGSYVRQHQGAGLGLSIVKRLVRLMGGELCIDSTVGEGTSVYAVFPLGLAGELAAERSGGRETAPHGGGLSILLVEDEAVNRLAMSRLLEKMGCAVTCASDGAQALERVSRERFDLVLMDVQMPVMDGVEATRRIRAGLTGAPDREVPIIAMTAYAMAGDRERFLEAGMDGYVSKPVDRAELVRTIGQVTGRILASLEG